MHRLRLFAAPALMILALAIGACAPLDETAVPAGDATAAPVASEASTSAAAEATIELPPTPLPNSGGPAGGAPQTAPAQRISFPAGGTSATVPGQLPANGMAKYVLNVQGGQFMIATLSAEQGSPSLSVSGADGTVLISPMAGAHGWSGVVPSTQDYFIDVAANAAATRYTLTVTVPPPSQPTPAVQPTAAPDRITFAAGGSSATRSGNLPAGGMKSYILGLQAGQTLDVTTMAKPGEVAVVVYGADGTVLQSGMGTLPSFNGPIPTTQDYLIDVKAGPSATGYSMTVTVPPVNPPAPAAQRVSFPAGGTSATRNGTLAANSSAKYVLALNAGKTFLVSTSGSPYPVAISVYGADGTVLISPMGSVPSFEGTIPSTQDYFVDVIAGEGPTNYTVTFTAPAQ